MIWRSKGTMKATGWGGGILFPLGLLFNVISLPSVPENARWWWKVLGQMPDWFLPFGTCLLLWFGVAKWGDALAIKAKKLRRFSPWMLRRLGLVLVSYSWGWRPPGDFDAEFAPLGRKRRLLLRLNRKHAFTVHPDIFSHDVQFSLKTPGGYRVGIEPESTPEVGPTIPVMSNGGEIFQGLDQTAVSTIFERRSLASVLNVTVRWGLPFSGSGANA